MARWLQTSEDRVAWPPAELLTESRRLLTFEQLSTDDDQSGLVQAFRATRPDGGCLLARFTVHNADATADWYLSRDQVADYGFADLLLRSTALREALPELRIASDSDVDLGDGVLSDAPYVRATNEMPREPGIFRTCNPLRLDGDLAVELLLDGPRRPVQYTAAHAKRVALAFTDEVMSGRYEEFLVQHTRDWWAPWFEAVVWDATWIVTDKRHQAVTVLCVTDDG